MHEHQEGKKRTYMDLEFYACNGFVRIHDRRDGGHRDMEPAKFLDRAVQLAKEIDRIHPDDPDAYRTRVTLARLANDVEEVCNEAAAQGSDFDPKAVAYKVRHKTYRRPMVQVGGGMVQTPSGLVVPAGSVE